MLVVQIYQKKKKMTKYANVTAPNGKYFLIRKNHVTLTRTKAVTYRSQFIVQLSFCQSTPFFQLRASYLDWTLDEPWPSTLFQTRTSRRELTMWTCAIVQKDLDVFLGSKMTPTIWILN